MELIVLLVYMIDKARGGADASPYIVLALVMIVRELVRLNHVVQPAKGATE